MESINEFEYAPTRSNPARELLTKGDSGSWHDQKRDATFAAVRSRLRDNHVKEKYYLHNPNQRMLSNCGVISSFQGHREPETLRGGVFTSKAGREYGVTRLKERVNELNVRASAAFGAETPQAVPSSLPRQPVTVVIEDAFTTLFDAVQAVEFTSFVPSARTVLTKLYEGGSELGSSKIGDYNSYTEDIRRTLVALLSAPEVDVPRYNRGREALDMNEARDPRYITAMVEGRTRLPIPIELRGVGPAKKRFIQQSLAVMDRIARLLDLIAKTANLSANERKLAIDRARTRDVAEASSRGKVNEFNNPDLTRPLEYPGPNQGKLSTPGPGDVRGLNPTGVELPPPMAYTDLASSGQSTPRSDASSVTSSQVARGDSGPAIMGLNAANAAPSSTGQGRSKKRMVSKKGVASEASRILAMLDDLADNPKKKKNTKRR
jgi:hypothetical protein